LSQELQQARYDKLLRRVGGIIGPGAKISEVLGELFPVLDVENPPIELLALMDTRLAGGGVSRAATAAVNTRVQLFNPLGSGKLMKISQVAVRPGANQLIAMGIVDTALGTNANVARFFDSRFSTTVTPVGQVRFGTNVALAPAIHLVFIDTGKSMLIENLKGVAVLSPGFGFQVSTSTVNTAILVSFLWEERPVEQSELNL